MRRIFIFAFVLFVASCSPRIHTASNFSEALAKHKTVAILPADVTIQVRPNKARRMTPEQLEDFAVRAAYDVQEKMYGWFLRRGDRFRYTVTFQDVTRTNAKLKEAGIRYADLKHSDRTKLAAILGVDAVMQNRLSAEKPMSEGASVALGVLTGDWGPTNAARTIIDIHDGASGNLLWKYDHQVSGMLGSSTASLVDEVMRNATRNFPYTAK